MDDLFESTIIEHFNFCLNPLLTQQFNFPGVEWVVHMLHLSNNTSIRSFIWRVPLLHNWLLNLGLAFIAEHVIMVHPKPLDVSSISMCLQSHSQICEKNSQAMHEGCYSKGPATKVFLLLATARAKSVKRCRVSNWICGPTTFDLVTLVQTLQTLQTTTNSVIVWQRFTPLTVAVARSSKSVPAERAGLQVASQRYGH